jgi:Bacterial Ig-like domain (group 2)/Galactose oxidase, central domain
MENIAGSVRSRKLSMELRDSYCRRWVLLALVSAVTVVLAACGGGGSTQTQTSNPPALLSIAVTPSTNTITLNATQQFKATGTYSDASTQDLTTVAIWSSSNTNVATISNLAGAQGLASGIEAGVATITASSGSITGTASLTVSGVITPVLVSIAVSPLTPTISLGMTQQFTATGSYSDGSTRPITSTVTWSSGTQTVATVSNSSPNQGVATGVAAGMSIITATSGSVSGTATLTVTAATLVSIAVAPVSPTIILGTTQQFTATATYSDGSSGDLTTSVTWTSGTPRVATISNAPGTQGLATSAGEGNSTITASSGSVNQSATLTVNAPTLVSVAVTPESPSILLGTSQQFTATGTYSDKSTQNITTSVTWASDTPKVATISNAAGSQGLATSVGAGTSTITATLGVVGSTVLTVTQSASTQTWTLHGPPGRSSHSAVYDPNSQQMIIFGGQSITGADLNDVWLGQTASNQDDSFTGETPSGTAPEARHGHAATYDSTHNSMTIFGGSSAATCLNDSWILNGANGQSGTPNWIALTTSGTTPAPRIYAGGVYDPNTSSMIVFGGNNCSTGYFDDVWVLSNANGESGASAWTQLAPSGTAPSARESASAVYDSNNNILMIYGGDAGGSTFGDVWVLSHANGSGGTPAWTQLSPGGTLPTTRTGQTAVYDSASDRMTVFGGINSGTTLADTWVLTSANGIGGAPSWTQIATSGTAPSLAYHSAVYDSAANNMYTFGGSSTQDKLATEDHAFTLTIANGASGGQKWVLGGPPVRYSQSAFYDSAINDLFVFGGQHASSNINFNDYWQQTDVLGSTNLQWTAVTTNGSRPSGRFGHTGLYDSASNRMMVFGGATGFPAPCVNDYYVLQSADNQSGVTPNWVAVSPTGTAPAARTLHASAYDGSTNTLIIFGGYNCVSTYYNDVWILSDANDQSGTPSWTHLQPTGGPPNARESSSAIYDSATNVLVVYGGDAGGNPFGDIWILSNANGNGGTPAWTQLNPSNNGPAARSGHTATYDSANNLMTIYGGFDGTNVLGDVWVLSAANGQGGTATWSQLTSGQVRRFHSSEYDPASNQLITYGGATGVTAQVPTSDVYTLTDANGVP